MSVQWKPSSSKSPSILDPLPKNRDFRRAGVENLQPVPKKQPVPQKPLKKEGDNG